MDKKKKQELAEFDERWKFEKTIQVPIFGQENPNWEKLREEFNSLQENQGDLYMTIDKLPKPGRIDNLKSWISNKLAKGESVTVHHSQIYNFCEKLSIELDVPVGEAVYKILYDKNSLREYFDLGKTVNVSINNVDAMETAESSNVSKDELEEFIEDG